MKDGAALDHHGPGPCGWSGPAGAITAYDYKRNGATNLFAALNVATARWSARSQAAHRRRRDRAGLLQADEGRRGRWTSAWCWTTSLVPAEVSASLGPRGKPLALPHFAPDMHDWWLNLVTVVDLTTGHSSVLTSITALIEAITTWVEHGNADPRTLIWHPARASSPRSAKRLHFTSQIKDTALGIWLIVKRFNPAAVAALRGQEQPRALTRG